MVVEWATYVCPMILFVFCFCNAGVKLGNGGIILVLFETPSGFAIFSYDGAILLQPNAIEVLYLSLPMHLSYSHGCLFVVVAFAIGLIFCVHVVTPSVLPRVTTHQSIHKHHDCVLVHEKNKFIATKNDPR
jgi:hypothetical protein